MTLIGDFLLWHVILWGNLLYKINITDSPLTSRHFERSATQSRTTGCSAKLNLSL